MSRIWAVIDKGNGEVVSTMHMNSADISDGGDYGDGFFVKDITSEYNPDSFITTKYWSDGWQNLPEKPQGSYKLEGGAWVFNEDEFLAILRADRNNKLLASDWTQLADVVFSAGVKTAWVTYRTALRNVPANNSEVTDIADIVWPVSP
tara:strand:+ start:2476 stop:2919 length:444 start_codon:yes stop_codon:yes gene_type:complete